MKTIYVAYFILFISILWLGSAFLSGLASAYSTNGHSGGNVLFEFSYGELSTILPIISLVVSIISLLVCYFSEREEIKVYLVFISIFILISGYSLLFFASRKIHKEYVQHRDEITNSVQAKVDSFSKDYLDKKSDSLGVKEEFITFEKEQNCFTLIYNKYDSFDYYLVARIIDNELLFNTSEIPNEEFKEHFGKYRDKSNKSIFENYKDYKFVFETDESKFHCNLSKYELDISKK